MHSSNSGFRSIFSALCLTLILVALWMVLHGYHGLTGDGQLYAFQAIARFHPQLTSDLYLQNTSQDQFTLFSPFYAWCIGILGLESAARLLALLFTLCLLAATWSFSSAVTDNDTGWLAVAFILIVSGEYGAAGVFKVLEPFLTARLPAEALTVTALACYVRGMKRFGLFLVLGALFIHPLMALPGLLLILCLWLPIRLAFVGAIGGVLATLAVAVVAANVPALPTVLTVMDASWLEVVRERSEFLFLQLWSIHDWDVNVQPLICLGFTSVVVADPGIRKLCAAAGLVGASGLLVASIGSLIGPVAIVVQGQAWRWVWVSIFVSVALVPFTALKVWRNEKCGPLCALLLVSGWALPRVDGTIFISLALFLWLNRARIGSRWVPNIRWATAALSVAMMVWAMFTVAEPTASSSGHPPLGLAQMHAELALTIATVLAGTLAWWVLRTSRGTWAAALVFTMLIALSIYAFPAAFKQTHTLASPADLDEFSDWVKAIPPASTVLVAPPQDVGAFVWFTLTRPNYLSLDQSTGVVFSRATALEVRRRSAVLMPLIDPDWKIRSRRQVKLSSERKTESATRRLTPENLVQVCADPQLGFVISPQKVGFDPVSHPHAGAWKDWNLYDCRKVRSTLSAT